MLPYLFAVEIDRAAVIDCAEAKISSECRLFYLETGGIFALARVFFEPGFNIPCMRRFDILFKTP